MLEICMCSLRPELLPDTFLKTPKVNLCWVRSVWQVVGYTVHVLWFVFRFGSIAGADIRAQAAGAHRLNVSKLVLVWTWTDWRSEGCCWVEQPGCWCRGYKRLTEQQFLGGVGGGSELSVVVPVCPPPRTGPASAVMTALTRTVWRRIAWVCAHQHSHSWSILLMYRQGEAFILTDLFSESLSSVIRTQKFIPVLCTQVLTMTHQLLLLLWRQNSECLTFF